MTITASCSSISFFSSSIFLSKPNFFKLQPRRRASAAIHADLTTLPVLSFEGTQVGSASLNLKSAPADTTRALVPRGLTTDLTNRRRSTAPTLTLTLTEVRGGGRKPYPKNPSKKILVAGTHANNLGLQCGSCTVTWQGVDNNTLISGTTILNAISITVDPSMEIVYSENPGSEILSNADDFSCAVVVVGEHTYAEQFGDNVNLTIPEPGLTTMKDVCNKIKCVVVLISGRPLVVEPFLSKIDALVAAWLPGAEGQGVTDVLFGDYGFTAKLLRTWFKRVDQLPMNVGDKHYDPLFPFDYGLTTHPIGHV